MKKIIQLVVLLCSLFMMSLSCNAATSLQDYANLMNNSDRTAVNTALNQVEKKYNVRTGVLTIRDSKVTDLGKYANTYLNRMYRDGRNGNMLLVVNMATNKFYVSTDNNMRRMISDSYGVKEIGNSAAINLKNRNYKQAFLAYASAADKQLDYYNRYKKPMPAPVATTTAATKAPAEKKKGGNMGMALGGAVLVGAIAAFVYGGSLKASMSNVASAVQADQYMKEGSFNITDRDDTFMYITYTRVKKNKPKQNMVNESDNSSDENNGGAGGGF